METSFGNWIRRRRKALDLTQEQLALQVGCSKSTIFKIEADERRPSRQVAELLAQHLEIPADQHALFIKVARQEKAPASLDRVPEFPEYAPTQAPMRYPGSLPVFPTQFLGREYEVEMAARQMQDPACRMLSLTGPGGVGKTRLAVEVARHLESCFADGVVFLPMGSVAQADFVTAAIADGIGVVFSGPAEPRLQVIQALRGRRVLLVLDNMEHLIPASSLLGDILQQAPGVKLLLTSREQTNVQWEWLFEVHGLPVPAEASAGMLQTNSAAALFLQRARQAGFSLPLAPREAAALVRICRLVDGLPLALELAAAWVQVMSIDEIARELERSLDLLATTRQDMPERHRSIQVAFDHSWKLLTPEERALLMKLAMFPGGFPREAAEAVAGASLALLSALARKSLLRYSRETLRYEFHELIRQFALARLQAQPTEAAQAFERYSSYYAHWLAETELDLKSARQMQASAHIRAETANWMVAWRWASQYARLDLLRLMAPCLYWYYELRDDYAAALSSYQTTIAQLRAAGAPDRLTSPKERVIFAFLVSLLPWFQFRVGNTEAALLLFAESLEIAGSHADLSDTSDQEAVYHIYVNWGYLALLSGDMVKAEGLTRKSLAIAQAIGSRWHLAIASTILGILELQQGHLPEASRQLMDSLALWRVVGDPRGLVFCMIYLSSANLASGSVEKAEAILLESHAMAEEMLDRWAQAFSLDLLGQVSFSQANPRTAVDRFQRSLALSQEIGDGFAATQTLIRMAEAQSAIQFNAGAKALFRQAYSSARQAGWPGMVLEALLAYSAVDPEISPAIKLSVCQSILASEASPLEVRRRAERLREQTLPFLTTNQAGTPAALSPEGWAQALLG